MCELKYKLYLWEDIPHLRLNKPQKTAMKTEQINATGIVIESLEHFFQVWIYGSTHSKYNAA